MNQTATMDAVTVIRDWPAESREAAQLVIDAFGEPDELTGTHLHWYDVGEWKRVIAQREFYPHDFPAPHIDCVESVILMHDIVTGARSLRFSPGQTDSRDPDQRVLSDADLEAAVKEGEGS